MQTSLAVARDRVVGVLLGLIMMWLVFDQLWSVSAGAEMKKTFVSSLRLMAELARDPLPGEGKPAIDRSYALRETINANFDTERLSPMGYCSNSVLRGRRTGTAEPTAAVAPQLRTLFVTRIALLKYRLGFPVSNCPRPRRRPSWSLTNGWLECWRAWRTASRARVRGQRRTSRIRWRTWKRRSGVAVWWDRSRRKWRRFWLCRGILRV